jgi:hypothetical protein
MNETQALSELLAALAEVRSDESALTIQHVADAILDARAERGQNWPPADLVRVLRALADALEIAPSYVD